MSYGGDIVGKGDECRELKVLSAIMPNIGYKFPRNSSTDRCTVSNDKEDGY